MIAGSENYSYNFFKYEDDRDNARKTLYRDYLKGVGLDCQLSSRDGACIKIHAAVLREYSVGIVDLAATTTEKPLAIPFKEYTDVALRVFAESLYLEEDDFRKKWENASIPIFEVLRFAHEYHQGILYKFCIKTICSTARKEDAEKVQMVNKICQNYFLDQLYERLMRQKNTTTE